MELLKYNVIDLTNYGNLFERIYGLIKWIEWFRERNSVDFIVFEDVVLQNESKYKFQPEYIEVHPDEDKGDNIKTFASLTKTLAILEYYCFTNGIDYKVIAPNIWRSSIGIGYGSKRAVLKQNAISFVKRKWNIDPPEDACEAICIGWSHVQPPKQVGWGTYKKI